MDELKTVDEVATLFNVKPTTIREWLKDGRLKGTKLGRQWRIKESDLQDVIENGITIAEDNQEETIKTTLRMLLNKEKSSDNFLDIFAAVMLKAMDKYGQGDKNVELTVEMLMEVLEDMKKEMGMD